MHRKDWLPEPQKKQIYILVVIIERKWVQCNGYKNHKYILYLRWLCARSKIVMIMATLSISKDYIQIRQLKSFYCIIISHITVPATAVCSLVKRDCILSTFYPVWLVMGILFYFILHLIFLLLGIIITFVIILLMS